MPKRAGWIVPGVVAIVAAAVLVLTPGEARAVLYDGGGGGGCYAEGPYYTTAPTLTPTGNGPAIRQLTVTEGTWVPLSGSCDTRVGSVTYDFYHGTTWEGSSGSGSWPSPWSGGTGHYTTRAADLNQSVKVVINACGNYMDCTTWTSPAYVPRQAPVPGTPWITGTAQVGKQLTANNGTWSGFTPITYTYLWQVSPSGTGSWTTATGAGATTAAYTVALADYGQYLHVTVTGTNAAGSASATSVATSQVLPAAPSGGSVSIAGKPQAGGTLTATPCSLEGWSPWSPSLSCEYRWQLSANGTSGWVNADGPGASSAVYYVSLADQGKYLRVTVTATDSGGSGVASTAATVVAAPGPLGPTGAVGPTGWVGPTGALSSTPPVSPSGGSPSTPVSSLPDSTYSTAPVLATGSVAGATSGSVVAYAEPSQATIEYDAGAGLTIPLTPVARASLGPDGTYTLRVSNLSALGVDGSTDGFVNFLVLVNGPGQSHLPLAFAHDVDFTDSLAGDSPDLASPAVAPAGAFQPESELSAQQPESDLSGNSLGYSAAACHSVCCDGLSLDRMLPPRWVKVGETFAGAGWAQFVYTEGSTSHLGAAFSTSGVIGPAAAPLSWSVDVSDSTDVNSNHQGNWGRVPKGSAYQYFKKFEYGKFEWWEGCTTMFPVREGYVAQAIRDTATEKAPKSPDKWPKGGPGGRCDPQTSATPDGYTWKRDHHQLRTWGWGVSILDLLGINLSSRTGADKGAALWYHFPTVANGGPTTYLCGNNDDPDYSARVWSAMKDAYSH